MIDYVGYKKTVKHKVINQIENGIHLQ